MRMINFSWIPDCNSAFGIILRNGSLNSGSLLHTFSKPVIIQISSFVYFTMSEAFGFVDFIHGFFHFVKELSVDFWLEFVDGSQPSCLYFVYYLVQLVWRKVWILFFNF